VSSPPAVVFITSGQRQLLWAVVQHDSVKSVHGVVADETKVPLEKTRRIINQLDFVFELRHAIKTVPAQGGEMQIGELGRAYLVELLNDVNPDLLSPEIRATFARDKYDLQLKFGDARDGFLIEVPAEHINDS
jgi:hypothetical protein